MKKFINYKIEEVELQKLSGGESGNETYTSECTSYNTWRNDSYHETKGDTNEDGDWIPTC